MARGEVYLENVDGGRLYIGQTTIGGELPRALETATGPSYAGIADWTRTMSKSPIIIPVPDQEPIGFDLNFIESDTITINTTWLDGIGDSSTYHYAEGFFKKENYSDTYVPYTLILGERTYYVLLERWTVSGAGGHGDTINVSFSLQIVEKQS